MSIADHLMMQLEVIKNLSIESQIPALLGALCGVADQDADVSPSPFAIACMEMAGSVAEVIEHTKSYVENHENDIALGINDFDDLASVFEVLIGRKPREEIIH